MTLVKHKNAEIVVAWVNGIAIESRVPRQEWSPVCPASDLHLKDNLQGVHPLNPEHDWLDFRIASPTARMEEALKRADEMALFLSERPSSHDVIETRRWNADAPKDHEKTLVEIRARVEAFESRGERGDYLDPLEA